MRILAEWLFLFHNIHGLHTIMPEQLQRLRADALAGNGNGNGRGTGHGGRAADAAQSLFLTNRKRPSKKPPSTWGYSKQKNIPPILVFLST